MEVRQTAPAPLLERALQKLLAAYIVTGILFMLMPGTFLGVWNLISISGERSLIALSPSWIQAHGHAQIFGWIGTFIIGIGFFSLSKMGTIEPFAVSRGWVAWALWTGGVTMRWAANVTLWNWRVLLPVSAATELVAFLLFIVTIRRHKSSTGSRIEAWMLLVIASTIGFLALLIFNAGVAAYLAAAGESPGFPHWLDQRFLVLATWGFPVIAVWGFNARWLPAFLGLKPSSSGGMLTALGICSTGVISALVGNFRVASALLLIASVSAALALNIFERPEQPAEDRSKNLAGVHPAFAIFVRLCYVWLLVAAVLSIWASAADRNGGIWGASRHALTVGFLAAMIFAIGSRIVPSFCGGRRLFSPALMFASCSMLNLGCLLRVASEIPAYEGFVPFAWHVLPYSAVVELIAVTVFALNLVLTLARPVKPVIDTTLYSISLSQGPKTI